MVNEKKTLTSKSAQPSGEKPEQPEASVEKDSESATEGPAPDDERSLNSEERDATANALLYGAYHLPGNSYLQDLYEYLKNNHPLFGICFHHPLHPVSRSLSFAAFLGSMVFGLAITNIVYLAFVLEEKDFDESYYAATISGEGVTGNENFDSLVTEVNVTSGMIALWTVGAAFHALYDNMIWSVAACACCRPGGRLEKLAKYRKYMPYVVMFVVVGTVALATMAVLIVAAGDSVAKDQKISTELKTGSNANAESYRFLLAYSIEILISLFVWYPIVTILLFTGILSCGGRVPFLGGRPQEMRELEQKDETKDEPEGEDHV